MQRDLKHGESFRLFEVSLVFWEVRRQASIFDHFLESFTAPILLKLNYLMQSARSQSIENGGI